MLPIGKTPFYDTGTMESHRQPARKTGIRQSEDCSYSPLRNAEIILDCISDGVITIDLSKNVTFMNQAMRRLLGLGNQQQVGEQRMACDMLVRGNICGSQDCMLERALCGERVANYETWVRHRSGRLIPVSINTDFLFDEAGRLIGLVEVIRDMSLSHELTAKTTEVGELRSRLSEHMEFGNLIGRSPRMQALFARLPAIAMSKASVLISGESGTGKDLMAYALHAHSPRKAEPFVVVNCSMLSEGVLESELFGHVKGAFTGASLDKAGRFELADRGTVFLDEVGALSHTAQVKLLRVLERGEFERVGSNETIRVDVRILAATNRDLRLAVSEGAFREDLYYRLRVIPVELPPLRERREDIPLLVRHFIDRFNAKVGKRVRIASDCLEILEQYPYPGNIRELHNAIEHAFACCDGPIIRREHLPKDFHAWAERKRDIPDSLDHAERETILRVLERSQWRIKLASERLGISRSTLWRKIKQFQLDRAHKL